LLVDGDKGVLPAFDTELDKMAELGRPSWLVFVDISRPEDELTEEVCGLCLRLLELPT
jgi:hypothetical protein